jgi:RNA polymerase sigma factor (sigma-70 family)
MVESWVAPLEAGDAETAWDRFIERYRRLVFSSIRHYTTEADEVMEVFAHLCEAFRENDFARLRRCAAQADPARPFSTLLVVIIHNLTIDWFRHRDGRPRLSAFAASLPPLRRRIFQYVFLEQRSHVESYELLRSSEAELGFGEFLEELRATYRAATSARNGHLMAGLGTPPPPAANSDSSDDDPAVRSEQRTILDAALAALPDEYRLAVQLYVVEEMPAEQVARALGYGSAKTVYNRVYRGLAAMRAGLERAGIRAGHL